MRYLGGCFGGSISEGGPSADACTDGGHAEDGERQAEAVGGRIRQGNATRSTVGCHVLLLARHTCSQVRNDIKVYATGFDFVS